MVSLTLSRLAPRAAPCHHLVPRGRFKRSIVPQAAAGTCNSSSGDTYSRQNGQTRLLRYPNGEERIIVYPADPESELMFGDEDWEEDEGWKSWDECNLWGSSCNPAFIVDDKLIAAEPNSSIASEDALLDFDLGFEQELAAQCASVVERVKNSYQVLRGSPWLRPKPLFVLATELTLHSLQVRFEKQEVMDELAMVLKRPELATSLTYSAMKDGVIAFETAEDAARYATCLEADMEGEVNVMQMDSTKLFLNAGEVDAVVVYLPGSSNFLPLPHQLATSLRAESAS